VNFVVLGIGVNLNMNVPNELLHTATSIKEAEGFEPVSSVWRTYFDREGKRINVRGSREVEGICMGIDSQGSLLVRLGSGQVERVIAGELV
jgi:biotin-(acetyl-CoA carboxylase) ligase